MNVLYVDDDEFMRELVSRAISSAVTNLAVAGNGREAMDLYLRCKPDIIITDICMPMMSGLEMARGIRSHDRQIPIIFLTSETDESIMKEADTVGAITYLPKPVDIKKLLHVIRECRSGLTNKSGS